MILFPLKSEPEMYEMSFFSYSHFSLRTLSWNSDWSKLTKFDYICWSLHDEWSGSLWISTMYFAESNFSSLKLSERAFHCIQIGGGIHQFHLHSRPPSDPLFSSLLRLNHSLQLIVCCHCCVCGGGSCLLCVCSLYCSTYHFISIWLFMINNNMKPIFNPIWMYFLLIVLRTFVPLLFVHVVVIRIGDPVCE